MKSVSDLGRLIKQKHPEYADLSDVEVGRLAKKHYPEYSDYTDDVQSVIEYYKPSRGRLTSWWQRGRAEGRSKLIAALNEEQRLVIEQGAISETAVLENKKSLADHELFIAHNHSLLAELQHKELLIQEATAKGLSLETDQEVKKHKALAEIDLDKRWKEISQDLNAADLVQMGDHQLLAKEREYLAGEIRARHQLLTGNDPQSVKDELVTDMNQHIQFLKDRINARQARLLFLENGPEPQRLKEAAPNSPGLDSEEAEADTE